MAEKINKAKIQQSKWTAVFELMQVVINGKPPKELFKARRPLESKNNHTLDYRIDNYHPVQTSLFKRAIQQYIEVLSKSDVQIQSQSETLNTYSKTFKRYENGKRFSLKEWLLIYIAEKRQLDPNGLIVLYPRIKFDDNGVLIIPQASTESIDLEIDYIPFDEIEQIDEGIVKICIGDIEIGEKEYDYYLVIDEKQYDISMPFINNKGDIEYKSIPYYTHNIGTTPVSHIGGSYMTESYDKHDTFDYFVSDFFGAVAFASYMITSLSDKQVMNARFNHPIKYQVKRKCAEVHSENKNGVWYKGFGEEQHICSGCSGSGYQKDTDMFGTYELEQPNTLNGDVEVKSPIGFVTPPIDSLKYINDDFNDYYTKTANELCVNVKQNVTNASAESKSYDIQAKVSLISYIVEDVLRIAKEVFSFAEMLLENKAESTVIIKKPDSWDIKSKDDILTELVNAKTNNAPYSVLIELTRELLLKELNDYHLSQMIVELLIKKDKLIVYGITDLKDARVIFGNDITQNDLAIHLHGLNVLKSIVNRNIEIKTIEQLETLFDTEIQQYFTNTLVA